MKTLRTLATITLVSLLATTPTLASDEMETIEIDALEGRKLIQALTTHTIKIQALNCVDVGIMTRAAFEGVGVFPGKDYSERCKRFNATIESVLESTDGALAKLIADSTNEDNVNAARDALTALIAALNASTC